MAKTRVVAYIRTSTDKQEISPEAQKAKISAYAELYELQLVETVVEVGSARSLDRPGLQRALAMLKDGSVTALLIVKLDRLTRSVADLGRMLEEYFASGEHALLSVSEQIDTRTAGGRLVLNVLASVSQWEREVIGERTKAAMQHKIAMGEFIGGQPPYGSRLGPDGVRLIESAEEQEVLAAARRLRAAGLSLRSVACQLNAEGLRSRKGKRFTHSQVARMVG
jgi:DNA invertase Pin-like site-specific DNA recombinase